MNKKIDKATDINWILSDACNRYDLDCNYIKYQRITNLKQYTNLTAEIIKYYSDVHDDNLDTIKNDLIKLKNIKFDLEYHEKFSTGISLPVVILIPSVMFGLVFSLVSNSNKYFLWSFISYIIICFILLCFIKYLADRSSNILKTRTGLILYINTIINIVENLL